MVNSINQVARLILKSKSVVVFTGAGISTESGVPDFRSPGGIWDRYDPNEFTYQKFLSSETSREKFWTFYTELWSILDKARPNRGHEAISGLNQIGKLDCLECGRRYPSDDVRRRLKQGEKSPRCPDCRGILKPATVTFGQALPEKEMNEAQRRASKCDLFMVIGSSMLVYPAAQIPLMAKDNGAKLVIINLAPTPHDPYTDIVIHEKIGITLSRIIRRVKTQWLKQAAAGGAQS